MPFLQIVYPTDHVPPCPLKQPSLCHEPSLFPLQYTFPHKSPSVCPAEEEVEERERWAWLKERRDAQGRTPDDPEFNRTTILIPASQQPK